MGLPHRQVCFLHVPPTLSTRCTRTKHRPLPPLYRGPFSIQNTMRTLLCVDRCVGFGHEPAGLAHGPVGVFHGPHDSFTLCKQMRQQTPAAFVSWTVHTCRTVGPCCAGIGAWALGMHESVGFLHGQVCFSHEAPISFTPCKRMKRQTQAAFVS